MSLYQQKLAGRKKLLLIFQRNPERGFTVAGTRDEGWAVGRGGKWTEKKGNDRKRANVKVKTPRSGLESSGYKQPCLLKLKQ